MISLFPNVLLLLLEHIMSLRPYFSQEERLRPQSLPNHHTLKILKMATLPVTGCDHGHHGYQRSLVRFKQRVQLIDINCTLWLFGYHFKNRG
jgi:hypothetical protein